MTEGLFTPPLAFLPSESTAGITARLKPHKQLQVFLIPLQASLEEAEAGPQAMKLKPCPLGPRARGRAKTGHGDKLEFEIESGQRPAVFYQKINR